MPLGEWMGPEAPLPAPWLQVPIMGLTADSRAVKPGYLFAALPGSRTDGADYTADASARGPAPRASRPRALCAARPGSPPAGGSYIAAALGRGAAAILMPQGVGRALNGT